MTQTQFSSGGERRSSARGRTGLGLVCAAALLVACGRDEPAAPAAGGPAPAKSIRFVKLEALTEWNGNPWASVAELNLIDATGATLDRKGWVASADSATANDVPANAIDGNINSFWHTPWEGNSPPPHALVVDLGGRVRVSGFRYLARQDKLVNGTIAKYRFYVSNDGVNWGDPVAAGDFTSMSAPRTEKTVIFAAQTENHAPVAAAPATQKTAMGKAVTLRIDASDADGDPLTYRATDLPPGLDIAPRTGVISGTPIVPGKSTVRVSVADNKGATAKVSFDWTVLPPAVGSEPMAMGEVRFVRLEEVSEVEGRAWASVAEFNLIDAKGETLPRAGWTAIADSADVSDKPGNAIDGSPTSIWHSHWDGASPPPPHSLIVDLGKPVGVRGFRYLPRQDKLSNGMIAKFRFYTSADGVVWGEPKAEGDFSSMGEPRAEKTVILR